MYLLKKGTFQFDKLSESGYKIDEQPNLIAKKQFVNGNRKKITTSYVDVVIEIDLTGINANDIEDYLDNLIDGTYEYYSFKDMSYKTANFIITLPTIPLKKSYSESEMYFDSFSVTLEKSSDVGGSI